MKNKKVYHLADLDEAHHWCEDCGPDACPPGKKVYVDAPKEFCNPAFWCEDCVKKNNWEVLDWVFSKDYHKLKAP